MKIGIDARLWNETGVGRYIRNLIEQLLILDKKNNYYFFVLPKDEKNIKSQISKIKNKWKMENGKWKIVRADVKWHTIKEQLEFSKILNRENLDLMHFPYFSVPILYNRPFIVTIHDLIIDHFPTGQASTLSFPIYNLKLLGYKFIIRQAARKAKKIITVSNATKEEVVDHLGVDEDKVVVTYEGVDQEIISSKSQITNKNLTLRLRSGQELKIKNYFLYVGNAYPHKNLERLLKAFNLFCHPELVSGSQLSRDSDLRQNDTKLVLVGKEDYFYNRLKEKVKEMGLSDEVIFLQNVSDEELSSLYQNALALIIPSLMEGFGLPALEAMANHCFVLTSDIPAIKEICQDSAIYFDPYNTENIAEKMEDVCSNGLNQLNKKIEDGFCLSKKFSWEKMARETLKIYEEVVNL